MKKDNLETNLASRTRAMIPAASGALADVPVCESVHCFRRSVVNCNESQFGKAVYLWSVKNDNPLSFYFE